MSMIEKVARAMYSRLPGPDGTEIFDEEPWRSCLSAARAALEAMQEPTEEMYDAVSNCGLMWKENSSTNVWKLMIGGALGPASNWDPEAATPARPPDDAVSEGQGPELSKEQIEAWEKLKRVWGPIVDVLRGDAP